jgi:hypothetical protein
MDFENMTGSELIELISWKDEYPREAEMAFTVFCSRYESDLIRKAEIFCSKFGYSEVEALLVANCTFDRVWKYPTFDMKKSNVKSIDNAIIIWMTRIAYNQMVLLKDRGTCSEPSQEEDLSVISDVDELIQHCVGDDLEKRKELKSRLNIIDGALLGISEKHRIIYLTYKAYEEVGKNIPRSVTKKLREQLDLTQTTIRVYKMEANQHISDYLAKINGNK